MSFCFNDFSNIPHNSNRLPVCTIPFICLFALAGEESIQ